MNKNILKIKSELEQLRFRKGVSALIINNKKEFLLVNLESFKNKYFAIPGGGIDHEETLKDAVYREIQEELNIEKQSLLLVGKSDLPIIVKFKTIKINNGKEFDGMERYFFGFKFIGNNNQIKVRKGEVRTYKWVAFDQLKNYLLFDNQLEETSEKIIEIFGIEELR